MHRTATISCHKEVCLALQAGRLPRHGLPGLLRHDPDRRLLVRSPPECSTGVASGSGGAACTSLIEGGLHACRIHNTIYLIIGFVGALLFSVSSPVSCRVSHEACTLLLFREMVSSPSNRSAAEILQTQTTPEQENWIAVCHPALLLTLFTHHFSLLGSRLRPRPSKPHCSVLFCN